MHLFVSYYFDVLFFKRVIGLFLPAPSRCVVDQLWSWLRFHWSLRYRRSIVTLVTCVCLPASRIMHVARNMYNEPTSPFPFLIMHSARLESDKYKFDLNRVWKCEVWIRTRNLWIPRSPRILYSFSHPEWLSIKLSKHIHTGYTIYSTHYTHCIHLLDYCSMLHSPPYQDHMLALGYLDSNFGISWDIMMKGRILHSHSHMSCVQSVCSTWVTLEGWCPFEITLSTREDYNSNLKDEQL